MMEAYVGRELEEAVRKISCGSELYQRSSRLAEHGIGEARAMRPTDYPGTDEEIRLIRDAHALEVDGFKTERRQGR